MGEEDPTDGQVQVYKRGLQIKWRSKCKQEEANWEKMKDEGTEQPPEIQAKCLGGEGEEWGALQRGGRYQNSWCLIQICSKVQSLIVVKVE